MNESERAVMESARFAAMESYFEARPQIAITRKLECIFEAGFDAAYAEVRRLREENERLRAVLESACEKMKQCRYVEARSDMLQAIDAARGAK